VRLCWRRFSPIELQDREGDPHGISLVRDRERRPPISLEGCLEIEFRNEPSNEIIHLKPIGSSLVFVSNRLTWAVT
jgi:hypothetical protein